MRTLGKSFRDPVSLCEHLLESQQVPCLKQAKDPGYYDWEEISLYLMLNMQLHVMVSVNITLIYGTQSELSEDI